ncbi:hypothetical protein CI109_101102 [Kwoniella shandongensis]|uniref:Uncharacterized protein n=1 Tax=Kwoniella shandongensis TaxID=1734106 RepID=A0A5M6C4Y8_9TREE|nr:uncharacterized protein CI109_001570 [Kwoniella shandongensis]KAA5530164.1 hypothetical protein CI109_001570 [Kwoniella shandongensis]
MFPGGNFDLSAVPLAFLEAYPFPAFVLVVPVTLRTRPRLIARDTDVTIRHFLDDVSPLAGPSQPASSTTVVWGNERWYQLTQGRTIGECVDYKVQNRLQAWVEGEDAGLGAEGVDGGFGLEMQIPEGVTLTLAKTIVPLSPPSTTHAFCILTSQKVKMSSQVDTPNSEISEISMTGSSTTGVLSPGIRQSISVDSRTSFSSSSNHRNSTYSDHRPSNSSSFARSSVDTITSTLSISSPSSGSASGSYFNSSLHARDDRPRSRVRRKSPNGAGRAGQNAINSRSEEFWKLVEDFDWSTTRPGPRETWKEVVDPVLSITFESTTQDCVWLGPDMNLIYNQVYSKLVDHPKSFGRPAKETWEGVWDQVEPVLKQAWSGTPIYRERELFLFKRHGPYRKLQESYQTWRYVPIKNKDGSIMGLFNQSIDVTDTVLLERRVGSLRDLSEQMLQARSVKEYYEVIADVLEQNKADSPFALCYRVQVTDQDVSASTHVEAILQCTTGVPDGHPSSPYKVHVTLQNRQRANFPHSDRISSPTLSAISALSSGSNRIVHSVPEGNQWPIHKALSTRQCVLVDDCSDLISGYPLRQWDELPYSAIVVPICSEASMDIPDAVLIIGLNVRRPYDEEYDNWVHSIRSQLTTSLTSVKAHEAEAKLAEDRARMDRAKAAWFRGAAHDLRSPLTLIAGPVADVLDSTLSPTQRQALSTAQRNIERLMRLVNALMDFSRLEAGRMEGRFVPTDLGEFVTELASLFRPAVERLGMQFAVDVQPSDELVYIDPSLFETAISNMIGNALKYSDSGSITVRVRYSDHAEVSVIDTGVGIPKDELDSVTEWFHRATNAIHAGTQGTGLGLAITKELIRLHQGELIIQSETAEESGGPHGSTFMARVPLSFRPALPPTALPRSPGNFGKYGMAVVSEAMRWAKDTDEMSETNETVSTTGSASKFSEGFLFDKSDVILVADDNADMRDYIKRIFTPYCRVEEASNGLVAFEKALEIAPKLILSDMAMPKMNGLDLLAKIKEHPSTRLIPTVLLSAIADDESRVEALMMGAEDYLAKPFRPKELVARVHLHLQVGKKRAKLEELYAEREMELTVLSDYCPTGIVRGNNSGSLTYANAAWRETSGIPVDYPPDDWPQWVDDESRNRLSSEWSEWLSSDRTELRIGWRWMNGRSVQATMVRLDQFKPGLTGVMGCVVDITHEEQRLVEAEERRKAAEESKYQQELLIDLTSHEIRTPVSAILQCSSLVKENLVALKEQLRGSGQIGFVPTPALLEDLEEDVEALESIYQCGLVQERIAGDVLSLARIQLDMLSLHDIEMDLRREAKKVLSVFASEAKMKKIELVLEFGKTLGLAKVMSIKTDPVRLGQVVTNLISNAIRFTASSDVRRITVQYDVSFVGPSEDSCALPIAINVPEPVPAMEDTPIWLFVSVTDTGPGMSPKELAVLFQRFAQGNKMIHTKYGGSGLGLFICRKITELLGGRIEVLSQLGQGTVFRFFIKTRTVAPPSALASYMEAASLGAIGSSTMSSSFTMTPSSSIASSRASSMSSSATPSMDGGNEHILIVEDNIINQTVLKRQIVKAGLTCDVANNGLEALNIIRETHRQARRGGANRKKLYDVVLMDLEMPVMDGLTAIKEIRQAESSGTMKRNMVMALTGNARQGQIDQALAAGMDDVVIKPYVLSDLLKKIRAMRVKKAELDSALEL